MYLSEISARYSPPLRETVLRSLRCAGVGVLIGRGVSGGEGVGKGAGVKVGNEVGITAGGGGNGVAGLVGGGI